MAKKKMRVAGSKLKILARMVESPGIGRSLKKTISKQMGLSAIAEAQLAEDEVPAQRPFAVWDPLKSGKAGGTGRGGA